MSPRHRAVGEPGVSQSGGLIPGLPAGRGHGPAGPRRVLLGVLGQVPGERRGHFRGGLQCRHQCRPAKPAQEATQEGLCALLSPPPTPGIAPRDLLLSPLSRGQDSISAPSHRRTSAATAATAVSPPPTQPFGVPAGKHPPGTKILSHWGTQRPSVLCTELPRQMGSGSRELIIFIFYFFWGGVPSRWQASEGGGTRGDFGAVLPLKLNTRQRGAVPASRSSPGTASGRRGPAMDALRPGGLWERAPSCFLAGARVCTYRGVRASVLRVYACAAYVWGGCCVYIGVYACVLHVYRHVCVCAARI